MPRKDEKNLILRQELQNVSKKLEMANLDYSVSQSSAVFNKIMALENEINVIVDELISLEEGN